jgi:lipoprotein-anchoring transpeptidase ErfK/SrfK
MRRVVRLVMGLSVLIAGGPAFADGSPQVLGGVYPGAPQAPNPAPSPHRSALGGGFLELMLTGSTGEPSPAYAPRREETYAGLYAAPRAQVDPDGHPMREPPPEFRRQEVDYHSSEPPGTLVIDTVDKFLYLVEPGGRAMRYGVGVGRPGFEWAGVKHVSRKAEWPDWTPPPEMLLRRPDLPRHMDGGPENPLGARALYLGSSMYRIHGTNEPWTIGQNVSSGCIRMMNEDVMDLYERVKVGTKVIVI